jgi:hypothetical protein
MHPNDMTKWGMCLFIGGERAILDSGRDFETAQPEAAGSAPTSEAEFQHFRSPGTSQKI